MEIGTQMQFHKKKTNSELIYEEKSIWSDLIFIKIIGSDTLWFPLPPSEVPSFLIPVLEFLYARCFRLFVLLFLCSSMDVPV